MREGANATNETSVYEYEGVVDKLCGRHCAGVHHHLVRINPLTSRRNTRIRGGGRPYSETSRNQSGGSNGSQSGLTHLSSPVQIISWQARCQTITLAAVMAITNGSILPGRLNHFIARLRPLDI